MKGCIYELLWKSITTTDRTNLKLLDKIDAKLQRSNYIKTMWRSIKKFNKIHSKLQFEVYITKCFIDGV